MSGLRSLFLEGGEKGCVNPQSCFDSKTNSVDLFKKKKYLESVCYMTCGFVKNMHQTFVCFVENHAYTF